MRPRYGIVIESHEGRIVSHMFTVDEDGNVKLISKLVTHIEDFWRV